MNRTFTRRRLVTSAVALAAVSAAGPLRAQAFPSRPVRILVGFSAGGGMDTLARLLATELQRVLGQQVVVENRAGASGMIAADGVAKAPADGHTLLVGESGLLIVRLLRPDRGVDPLAAFTPVAGLFIPPLMVVANNDVPIGSPQELVRELRARPGHYAYATSGVGTVHHLGFEWFMGQTGTSAVHIPYRGAAQIIPDVIGGQVPLAVVSATAGIPHSRGGRLRAVAMMSPVSLPGAEHVRPLADVLPGFDVAPRVTLLAPAGTPAPVVQQINLAVRSVLAEPATVLQVNQQGAVPAFMAADALAADLPRESATWGEVIRSRGIRLD